jgi:hypothetical protein
VADAAREHFLLIAHKLKVLDYEFKETIEF